MMQDGVPCSDRLSARALYGEVERERMHQVLFRTESFAVYSSYVMMALASILAMVVILKEAKRTGMDLRKVYLLLLCICLSAAFGGHGFNCLFMEPSPDLSCFVRFWEGNMSFYGGFILAGVVFVVYVKMRRLEILRIGDLFAPGSAIFLAVYRIGCFLHGCCWGKPTNLPWALTFPTQQGPRHPTQLYSSLNALILFSILWSLRKRKRFQGEVCVIFLLYYSLSRFIIEIFREDPMAFLSIPGPLLSESQIISIPLFISSLVVYLYLRRGARNTGTKPELSEST
jgi:phosphatidylglycerol:prolipoprotein diacylglycerol transferase